MKMKPGFRSKTLEVAPGTGYTAPGSSRESTYDRKPSFKRESLPHTDTDFVPLKRQGANTSFRRDPRRAPRTVPRTEPQTVVKREDTASSPHKIRNELPLNSGFSESGTVLQVPSQLPTRFTSPPLLPGLLHCLNETLGPSAIPTPIQALSLKWLLNDVAEDNSKPAWKQFLLASETGSGKSVAYLLPLLQNLKETELKSRADSTRPLNPRALVLAPTHELARQLSGFAKSLLHKVKLRVLCASRANVKNTKEKDSTAHKMVAQFEASAAGASGEFEMKHSTFPVDLVVGTPMKLLEMVRGRGWDRLEGQPEENNVSDPDVKPRRGRDKMVGVGKWRSRPEMGLANVEWVIVDEADVLFGSLLLIPHSLLYSDIFIS